MNRVFSVPKDSPMKMHRDIKESLEMLLIARTGGEEEPERGGGVANFR